MSLAPQTSATLADVYEQMLAGATVGISCSSLDEAEILYARLRVIKSRYDKKHNDLFGAAISEGKVIKFKFYPELSKVEFSLIKPTRTTVSITDIKIESSESEE